MTRTNRIQEYRQRASFGDWKAQYDLAWEYYRGEFVPKDVDAAITMLRQVEKTHPEFARFNIAKVKYAEGDNSLIEDVREDCAAGYGPSLYLVGSYFLKQVGGERGRAQAIEYYRAAAANGHLPSEYAAWKLSRLGFWNRFLTALPALRAFLHAVVITARGGYDIRTLI